MIVCFCLFSVFFTQMKMFAITSNRVENQLKLNCGQHEMPNITSTASNQRLYFSILIWFFFVAFSVADVNFEYCFKKYQFSLCYNSFVTNPFDGWFFCRFIGKIFGFVLIFIQMVNVLHSQI